MVLPPWNVVNYEVLFNSHLEIYAKLWILLPSKENISLNMRHFDLRFQWKPFFNRSNFSLEITSRRTSSLLQNCKILSLSSLLPTSIPLEDRLQEWPLWKTFPYGNLFYESQYLKRLSSEATRKLQSKRCTQNIKWQFAVSKAPIIFSSKGWLFPWTSVKLCAN